jgi:hypothetical protein
MNYEKPRAVVVASACVAIQGTGKGSNTPLDIQVQHTNSPAYEADE